MSPEDQDRECRNCRKPEREHGPAVLTANAVSGQQGRISFSRRGCPYRTSAGEITYLTHCWFQPMGYTEEQLRGAVAPGAGVIDQ